MLQSLETRACENETGKHKEHQGEAATPPGAGQWERGRARTRSKSVLAQVKDPGLQEQRAAESHSGKEAVRLSSTRAWAAACQLAQFSLPAALA